jgi:alanine racemase
VKTCVAFEYAEGLTLPADESTNAYFVQGKRRAMSAKDKPLPVTWLEIDVGILERNIRRLQEVIGPEVGIIGVAKSDGYGHGLPMIANILAKEKVNSIAVSNAEDALRLRQTLPVQSVLVLYPVPVSQIASLVSNNIDITITDMDALYEAEQAAKKAGVKAQLHIQVETGMHYFGADATKVQDMAMAIESSPHLLFKGVATHFSAADTDAAFTELQHDRFTKVLKSLQEQGLRPDSIHTANSAALDTFKPSWDVGAYRRIFPDVKVHVRIGCLLYGTYKPKELELENEYIATSLVSHILELKEVKKGDTIGYFNTHKSIRSGTLAVAPVGWGSSGYFPAAGQAIVNDTQVDLVGPISANTCVFDVSDVPAHKGDRILLFGDSAHQKGVSIDSLAMSQSMFVNRLIASLGAASHRVYVRDEA